MRLSPIKLAEFKFDTIPNTATSPTSVTYGNEVAGKGVLSGPRPISITDAIVWYTTKITGTNDIFRWKVQSSPNGTTWTDVRSYSSSDDNPIIGGQGSPVAFTQINLFKSLAPATNKQPIDIPDKTLYRVQVWNSSVATIDVGELYVQLWGLPR